MCLLLSVCICVHPWLKILAFLDRGLPRKAFFTESANPFLEVRTLEDFVPGPLGDGAGRLPVFAPGLLDVEQAASDSGGTESRQGLGYFHAPLLRLRRNLVNQIHLPGFTPAEDPAGQ